VPILPKERDPRLITIRRGGTLTDEHHRLLADWALLCAEHVLHLFEDHQPGDSRPGDAIDVGRAWIRGEVRMGDAHRAAFQANAAARGMPDPASSLHCRRARRLRWLTSPPMTWALRRTPSGRPAHASQPTTLRKLGPRSEWQRVHLPAAIRELVLDDQQRRSAISTRLRTRLARLIVIRPRRRDVGSTPRTTPPTIQRDAASGCTVIPAAWSTRSRSWFPGAAGPRGGLKMVPAGTCRLMPSSTHCRRRICAARWP